MFKKVIVEKLVSFLQLALLYTSCGGQRRIRVHNLCLQCAPDLPTLYRSTDLDAIVNYFAKLGIFLVNFFKFFGNYVVFIFRRKKCSLKKSTRCPGAFIRKMWRNFGDLSKRMLKSKFSGAADFAGRFKKN